MSKRFKTSQNYFIVEDTVTGIEEIREPKNDVIFKNDGGLIHFYDKSTRMHYRVKDAGYSVANVVNGDNADAAFGSIAALLLYLETNTGDSPDITGVWPAYVDNVTAFELAVAAQLAGQVINVMSGVYYLTKELVPLFAATTGEIHGIGDVEIIGHDDADSAISIVATGADATFEYTLSGSLGIKGGLNKIGLHLTNPAISQKTILSIKDSVHFEDNGTGVGFKAENTGTGAMRVYAQCDIGTGWDTVEITNKNADDKWHFRGINFDEVLTAAVVAIADNWYFESCRVSHAGMAGGHATNVINVVNCHTIETAAVALADAADFPDAFSPTII